MRFHSGPRGVVSAGGLVALLIAAIWLGGQMTGQAVAERAFGLPSATLANAREPFPRRATPQSTTPFRLASHHEEDEGEAEELEEEFAHLEMERAALETFFGGLELVEKMAGIAGDNDEMAVLAVTTLADEYEPEEKIGLLKEVIAKAPSKAARRIARLSLAEVYNNQGETEAALGQMRSLIFETE